MAAVATVGGGTRLELEEIRYFLPLLVFTLVLGQACQSTQPTVSLPELQWPPDKPGWVLIREVDLKRLVIENEQNKKRLEILHREGVRIP